MSTKRLAVCGVVLGLVALLGTAGWAYQDEEVSPEQLLPANSVIYLRADGSLLHEEAFQQTAAYTALVESGLAEVWRDVLKVLAAQAKDAAEFEAAVNHVMENGFSLAVAVEAPEGQPPAAWGTIVVPQGGDGVELLAGLLARTSELNVEIEDRQIGERQVKYLPVAGLPAEIGWWQESNHLLIAFGMNAVSNAIQVADGNRDNLTESPMWEIYGDPEVDFDLTSIAWFDFSMLREMFGEMPLPLKSPNPDEPTTVNNVLETLGIHNLNHIVGMWGYRGEALWSEVLVDAPGERTGLLSLMDQPSLTLDDLPPVPWNHHGFTAWSFQWQQALDTLIETTRGVLSYASPAEQEKFEQGLQQAEAEIGIPLAELLAPLGNINCVYTDTTQGGFGLGTVGIFSVEDDQALLANLKKILDRVQQEAGGDFRYRIVNENGHTKIYLEFPRTPLLTPTISIDKEWMLVGLMPQAVRMQLLRMYEDFVSFDIQQNLEIELADLPAEFTSLSVADPTPTYQRLISVAPMLFGFLEIALKDEGKMPRDQPFPVTVDRIPPAELVVNPLFYNVAMTTTTAEGTHAYTRQSLPGVPLMGSNGTGVGSVGALAMTTALLMPAVQQAREAARRSQSSNNLKQIGLALHMYADSQGHLPEGTIPNEKLEPEERLSWLVSILPYVDERALYESLQRDKDWAAPANEEAVSTVLPVFQNPSLQLGTDGNWTTYAGIGGLGIDGPTLPVTSPRAGFFGYDRITKMEDVKDGLSNTLMTSEIDAELGPWAAGGRPTVRPFTERPYINGPDGFGGNHVGGVLMGFGDGSVRFISENIDPAVVEAMATINGGEAVGDF